jgi:peptidoglycan/xylan/chitin deacetylase (PgdA/CDA1 family)
MAPARRRADAHRVRVAAAVAAEVVGLSALARARTAGLRILMYHGIARHLRGPAAYGHLFIDAQAFDRHMRHLRRHYHPITLADAARAMEAGQPFPARAVAVTIDDGYRGVLDVALPILAQTRVPATVFVCAEVAGPGQFHWFDALRVLVADAAATGAAHDLGAGVRLDGRAGRDPEGVFAQLSARLDGQPPVVLERLVDLARARGLFAAHPELHLAEWPEWRAAADTGWLEVGSHSLRHGDLSRLAPETCARELTASKQQIDAAMRRPCEFLAYPQGGWSPSVAEHAAAAGYRLAVTTDDGINPPTQPRMALRRTMIGDKGSAAVFRARVSGAWSALRRGSRRATPAAPSASHAHSHPAASPPHPAEVSV